MVVTDHPDRSGAATLRSEPFSVQSDAPSLVNEYSTSASSYGFHLASLLVRIAVESNLQLRIPC